jgi:hypothetical protein
MRTRALSRGVADGRVVRLAPTGVNPDARAAVVIPIQGSPYLVVRLPAPHPESLGGVGAPAGRIRPDRDPSGHDRAWRRLHFVSHRAT